MASHITIRNAGGKWVVRAGGAVLGESIAALELTEGDYPPVIYFPRADIAMAFLDRTDSHTTCPYKGMASYYSIETRNETLVDAAWSYEDPNPEHARISEHLAFKTGGKIAVEQT